LTSSASHLSKLAVTCVAVLALGLAMAACGDDGNAEELGFTLTTEGTESRISGPSSADVGEVEITLDNETDREGELQLIRAEGDHTAADVIEVLNGVVQGKPFPDWFYAGGGVGSTPAGESQSVVQNLQPGTYFAVDLEGDGPPKPDSIPEIEVTGEGSGEQLEADATVTAIDYGFDAETLPSGETEIVFENRGNEPHHLLASKIVGDATAEDVIEFFKTEKGEPPLQEEGSATTAVLEGGEAQKVTIDLEPGRYALYCFISDRQGGPPHVFKGMVDEVEVE